MYESLPPQYHDPTLWTPDLAPPPSARMPFHRRRWVQASASAVAGLVLGLVIAPDGGSSLREPVAEQQRANTDQEEVTTRADQVQEQADRLKRLEAELSAREEELTRRAEAVAAREAAAVAPAPPAAQGLVSVPEPDSDGQEAQEAPIYFGSCADARAAGSAPVRTGDPGYGRHLDRDGDGVGCE